MKGQAAVEYMVLLSAVLILALVVIAILGYMPGTSSGTKASETDTYWRSGRPFAILEAKDVPSAQSLEIVVQNTEAQDMIMTAAYVRSGTQTTPTTFSELGKAGTLAAGEKKRLELNAPLRENGATQYEYYISFDFRSSRDGVLQKEAGTKPLVGPSPPLSCKLQGSACANFAECCASYCNAGTCCVEYGACTVDAQCCGGHCRGGFCCQQEGLACASDAECCAGTACNIVNGVGTCLNCPGFGSACDTAGDCCPNMGCTATDEDDGSGNIIHTSGICCKGNGGHCTSDSQCCEGYCDLGTHSCMPCKTTGYCGGDNECCGGMGYYCNAQANGGQGDCERCKQGNQACSVSAGEQCCDSQGHYAPGGYNWRPLTCNNGACCQGEGYSNPTSCCAGFVVDPYPGHPYCCMQTGQSGCNSDSDCCWNNYCNAGTCTPVLHYRDPCDRDRQCYLNSSQGPNGNMTYCIGGQCCINTNTFTPPCTDSGQCCNNAQCFGGACCTANGAEASSWTECCADGFTMFTGGRCCRPNGAACTSAPQCCNSVCGAGGFCCQEIGGACSNDSQCCDSGGSRGFCSPVSHTCTSSLGNGAQCAGTRQCGNGMVCSNSTTPWTCQACAPGNPCSSDSDCCWTTPTSGYVCDMATHVCRGPSNWNPPGPCTRNMECYLGDQLAPPRSPPHVYCDLSQNLCIHRHNEGEECSGDGSCDNYAGLPQVNVCAHDPQDPSAPPTCMQCTSTGACVDNDNCCAGHTCQSGTCT